MASSDSPEASEPTGGQTAAATLHDDGQHLMDWLRAFARTGSLENTPYLFKWLVLGISIGIIAGVGSILLFLGIDTATKFFLGTIVGYLPPSPAGEGTTGIVPMARPWLLPVVTTLGGLISAAMVYLVAPEAKGDGAEAAIEAIHRRGGFIRKRIPILKLISSAITIGSGGSAGREGPAAQVSAGFGYWVGKWLKLNARDQRICVAVGIGAGIGSIFRAPLGGAVLSAEILYLYDVEVEAVIPALIASIVGYVVYGIYYGFAPIFGAQPDLTLGPPIQLLYYGILGLLCGFFGILYSRCYYWVADYFERLEIPFIWKPTLGGLIVGLMGLVLPQSLYMGYGWIQVALDKSLFTLPLLVILLVPFAKIVSTSLTVGSGGSGGNFGPGMVIGAMVGAAFWIVGHKFLPHMPGSPAAFVIVAMMGTFGGIAHAPLAVMLMVAEMTGNLTLLAPAMLTVGIASALIGKDTIYRSQLPHRASLPGHRVRYSFPLLSSLLVRDAMSVPGVALRADLPLNAVETPLSEDANRALPVVDARDHLVGILSREQLEQVPAAERSGTLVDAVAGKDPLVLEPNQPLDEVLEKMTERAVSWAPVVDNERLVGIVTIRELVRTYKSTLRRSVRRTTSLPADTSLFEVRLGPSSPLVGRTLKEAGLPAKTMILSITRGGETVFPRADTRLERGDRVMVMASVGSEQELRSYLEGAVS